MNTILPLFFLLLIGLQQQANAQQYFSAVVKDSVSLEPLKGVIVLEQGATNGAVTDIRGIVKIRVNRVGEHTFTIRHIGYNPQTIVVVIPQDSIKEILLGEKSIATDEVVVTSMRTNSRIENIPTRIEVLGMEDLDEESGIKPGGIASLIGDIAGIQIQQTSAASGSLFARIQGLNGRYTQILKDGLPVFGGVSGGFSIMQIPPLDLKQVEIIKGSNSTLYGGDAIGGIINLITKNPSEQQELSFIANQTTLLETNLNVYAAKQYKHVGYTLFAGQTIQKQGDVDKDGFSDVPNVKTTVFHPKLLWKLDSAATLILNYTATFDARKGGDMSYFSSSVPDTLYHVANNTQRQIVDISYSNNVSANQNLTVKASGSSVHQQIFTKQYDFDGTQRSYFSEVAYMLKHGNVNWVTGINVNGDAFNHSSATLLSIPHYSYITFGIFLQNTYTMYEQLILESGFRLDYHSLYKFFPLPRLSLLWKLSPEISARFNGGLGYKVPTIMGYVNPETDLNKLSANTSLDAERSQGINMDVNFQELFFDKLSLTINQAFFMTNLRSPVYDSSSTPQMVSLTNASQAIQTKGLQTYCRLHYDTWEVYAGYVYTDVQNLYDTKRPRPTLTPRHTFSDAIIYEPWEGWRFGIENSFIAGQRNQEYADTKNYMLIAAMIQYKTRAWSFVLNGENLLNIRQSSYEPIYDGTRNNPTFHQLWAPIDGRVVNFSVKWSLEE